MADTSDFRRRLADLDPLELPAGRPWRASPPGTDAEHVLHLPAATYPALAPLAAYLVVLSRYSRESDLAVGVRVPGLGPAVRADLTGGLTFADLVAHLDRELRATAAQPAPDWDLALGDERTAPLRAWFTTAPADDLPAGLVLRMTPGGETRFGYHTGQFDADTVARLAARWATLLASAAADPGQPVRELDLLTGAEREALASWNRNPRTYPADADVLDLVATQVAARPEAEAVWSSAGTLTYRQLSAAADRLAGTLRVRGVRPGSLVALCLNREPDLVVALLAVLRAGGASVPLDPEYPRERIAFVLRDTGADVLLTSADLRDGLPAESVTVLTMAEADPEDKVPGTPSATGTDPACVLYTSGSTGAPKGVVVPRSSLVNLLLGMRDMFPLRPGDSMLFAASITFDIAHAEVFLPLITGGRIVIASREQVRDPVVLARLITEHRVTLVQATPSAWRPLAAALAATPGRPGLTAFAVGEPLPPDLAQALLEVATRVVNGYGPTETTIYATTAEVRDPGAGITIGRPTPNTVLHVVDPAGQPALPGVPGELLIGGPGVTTGYLNRPELTAQRFHDHPGGRVYRTGDLVRWRPDGELEFVGRLDHQVKVRGFRIEPGEVEAVLRAHPGVAACVVVARTDVPGESGGAALVAYCVPRTGHALGVGALREWCGHDLPGHLVPTAFVMLPALPLTTSGKVDRRALPAPDLDRMTLETAYVTPRTPAERVVARTWSQALWLDEIGAHDDFFELGGDSLIATRVALTLGQEMGLEVPVQAVFDRPTVEGLAELLSAARRAGGFDRIGPGAGEGR